jgi:hypothetical protein
VPVRTGYYRFETHTNHAAMRGFGESEFIRLRDDSGAEWRGYCERQSDGTVRYHFRDSHGNMISGIADSFGILLRDDNGNTWRGFID